MLTILVFAFSISAIQASEVNMATLNSTNENIIQIEDNPQFDDLESINTNDLSVDRGDGSLNETSKNQTEFTSPTTKVYYKGSYQVTLKDSTSNVTLPNKTVSFVINDVNYTAATDSNGVASINLGLTPGSYKAIAYFEGDDTFESSNLSTTFKVLSTIKASNLSKYYKGSTKYGATFYDSQGNALANRNVKITVNGKSYTKKTNAKGAVSLPVDLKPGTYKVVSTDPITGYELTTTFKILSTISSSNLNKVAGDSKKFKVKFYKSNGKPLAKRYIKLKINGKTYKYKTSSNGNVFLSFNNFKKGTYKVICYNKDGLSKKYTVKVFKRKASTKLTTKFYKFLPNDTKKIKVKLSTSLADDSNSGRILKITVNGETYSRKTDGNGEVNFKLPSLEKGIYAVKYEYGGSKFFKASKQTNYVTIFNDTSVSSLKVKSTISFGYGAGTLFKVAYTADKVPLAKKTVTFSIDGKTYVATTDYKGIASIPIDLKIGNYTVNYRTSNDSDVNGTSGACEINVFKRSDCKLTWKSASSFKDSSQKFKVLLTDLNGSAICDGEIELTIDGETYYATTDSKGYATFETSVALGKYKVSVKFIGSNEYKSTSTSKSVNVKLSKFGNGLNQKNTISYLRQYLKSSWHCKVGNAKIKALVKTLTKGLTNRVDKAKAIFNYVRDTLDYDLYYNTRYGAAATLKNKKGNCVDHSHLLVAMYRTAGFKARYVHGVCHFNSGHTYGHVWTQVLIGKTWVCADATSYGNSLGKISNWNTKSYKIHAKYRSLPF